MDTDLTARHHDAPIDAAARERLAAGGLDLRLVTPADRPAFDAWLGAMARGFLDGERTPVQLETSATLLAYRRALGVYDPLSPAAREPVATFDSWVSELSVPGGRGIPSVAISGVTVAPTHRRRGILREMMAGELRTAAALGLPMAMLTVSESTIYGRFGFAPAADAARLTLDVKRAAWTGPAAPGRIHFISRERFRELAPGLHDAVRLGTPGEIAMPGGHWDRFAGTRPDADKPERLRAVQYADDDGAVRGVALYSVTEDDDDFTKSTVRISVLLATTDDAYAALWRFFLEMDLIATVTASELSVDEPLLWMISDRRAAAVTVVDHQYLRILDVAAALEARRYSAPGVLLLDVDDPLGVAGGRFRLTVDGAGRASVEPAASAASSASSASDADAPVLRLGIAELSAAYLGAVPVRTLVAAGRGSATDVDHATRMLAWHVPARLSFWY